LDQKKPVILCVDDEPANLRLLTRMLGLGGYEVVVANDGREAFDAVSSGRIDLVIMDVMMPEIDGYEACRLIKADERYRHIPVIMITALGSRTDRIRAIEEGADEFLVKPFDRVEVLARVKMLVRTKQLDDMLKESAKLATIGSMAGSVGNELRNPLGVMNNAVFYLDSILAGAGAEVREYLEIIKHEIDYSRRIISDFLDAVNTGTPRKTRVLVGEIVKKGLRECTVPENVAVRVDVPENLLPVNVDPSQMARVLQNIITNAVQSMPNGGSVSISARHDSDFVEIRILVFGYLKA